MRTPNQLPIKSDTLFLRIFQNEDVAELGYPNARTMTCPTCSDIYVHSSSPITLDGEANPNNLPDIAAWLLQDYFWVRGETLCIHQWCENGHQWALQFGFHKGQTYLRIVIGPDGSGWKKE